MKALLRGALLLPLALLTLQLFFLGRIAALAWLDPASTSFERSEVWRLADRINRVVIGWLQPA